VQIVILAGGLGTRLDPKGLGIPKALRKIRGKTILEWQVKSIGRNDARVLLLIGDAKNREIFRKESEYLSEKYGVTISLVSENQRMGTLGALKAAEEHLEENFIVLLGDILLDYSMEKLFSQLMQSRKELIAVARLTDHPEDSDIFAIGSNGSIKQFSHYPHTHLESNSIYLGLTGVFGCKRKFLSRFPTETFLDIWQGLNPENLKKGYVDAAFTYSNFKDVGTPQRLAEGEEFIDKLNFQPNSTLYLIDRDDTLIVDPSRKGVRDFVLNQNLIDHLKAIQGKVKNSKFYVVTNQPGISKGEKTFSQVADENTKLATLLREKGLTLDGLEFCPHHPHGGFKGEVAELKVTCFCRKPLPGMVIKIIKGANYSPQRIIVYGDSFFDYGLSKKIGGEFRWVVFTGEPIRDRISIFARLFTRVISEYGIKEGLTFLVFNLSSKISRKRWEKSDHL